jgi:hypothetical protein
VKYGIYFHSTLNAVRARENMWHFIMFRENIFHISLKRKNILLIIDYFMCDFPAIKLQKERTEVYVITRAHLKPYSLLHRLIQAVDQLQLTTCETRIGLLCK